jgi:hypothetical protein
VLYLLLQEVNSSVLESLIGLRLRSSHVAYLVNKFGSTARGSVPVTPGLFDQHKSRIRGAD